MNSGTIFCFCIFLLLFLLIVLLAYFLKEVDESSVIITALDS